MCLVGVGPGDPGLLTLRAYQLMRRADVVLYDRLVSNEILNLVRAEARMVYVGKRAGYHTRTQEEIHELLAAFADAGATILRLKGGDPLVFGRGGEEFEFLREHNPNVRVEVVPGITAAAGVGSELGIPLTHRGVATSVRLLTGHLREGAGVARGRRGRGERSGGFRGDERRRRDDARRLHGSGHAPEAQREAHRERVSGRHARGGDRARHDRGRASSV